MCRIDGEYFIYTKLYYIFCLTNLNLYYKISLKKKLNQNFLVILDFRVLHHCAVQCVAVLSTLIDYYLNFTTPEKTKWKCVFDV